jgi:hypothetical protein
MSSNMGGSDFLLRLEQLVEERHPALEVEFPTSAERLGGPTPDVVVSNPRTGAAMAAKVRAGHEAEFIPLAMLPLVCAVRERFRSGHPLPDDVVVITTGPLPRLVREGFARRGIEHFLVKSPEEAVERLNRRLEQL